MAFEKEIKLKDCKYLYTISPNIKKYTLRDTTFSQTKVGHYQLIRLLETIPNSGDGFPLKITINKELTGFKLAITDQSGLNQILQDKFYFLMDSLVEREIFSKTVV